MEKKRYSALEMEIVEFDTEDVIRTSDEQVVIIDPPDPD